MTKAVVSFTHLTMGKLFLRTAKPENLAGLAAAAGEAVMSHWTLREPTGALIIDVHVDEEAFHRDFTRSSKMFSDPLHRYHVDSFSFVDDEHEAMAVDAFARAKAAGRDTSTPDPSAPPRDLKNRLVSLNLIPHLPDGPRDEVHRALAEHAFTSVVHLVVRTPQGVLLIDPYLDEPALMDDFVFVHELLSGAGAELVNHWHPFTDRVHERAIDELAVGLGRLDELLP
jgi:hypothetical protein